MLPLHLASSDTVASVIKVTTEGFYPRMHVFSHGSMQHSIGPPAAMTASTHRGPIKLYTVAPTAALRTNDLGTLSADASGQLNILGHDRDAFGMDGTQIGIFEQRDEVSFSSFL